MRVSRTGFAGAVLAVVATAAQAQAATPGEAASAAAGSPMTRAQLLDCLERRAALDAEVAWINARAAALRSEVDAVNARVEQLRAEQKATPSPSPAQRDEFARVVSANNQRGETVRGAVKAYEQRRLRLDASVADYNAACLGRPFDVRDREAALAEIRARTASGPFEQGVAAYDQRRFDEARRLWLPLAEQGVAAAQFNLGTLYRKGEGVERDEAAAAAWFLKAAERGDVQAQLAIAGSYESGAGLARDTARAMFWYGAALANPAFGNEPLAAQRTARERYAGLGREQAAAVEQMVPYDGGRFVLHALPNGACIVALQGDITASASFHFDKVLERAKASGCASPTLLLESPGGNLADGLALGGRIRDAGLRTVVRAHCASSCGLVFLGGAERVLWGSQARIGFHQAASEYALANSRHCEQSSFTPEMRKVRAYLRTMLAERGEAVFQLLMSTSCDAITWVDGARAIELGVATKREAEEVDPFAFAPTPR